MQLVLRNSAMKVRTLFTGVDGEGAGPEAPTVTITRDSDGEEIVSSADAEFTGDGNASYTLDPADIPTVDLLRASWSDAEATAPAGEVGVVGAFMCSLGQITEAINQLNGNVPGTEFIREARERAEGFLEDTCNVAFRPSYGRDRLAGDGTEELLLTQPQPLSVLACSINGTALTSEEVDELGVVSSGVVTREGRWASGAEIDIAYEHGYSVPPPEADRVTARLARLYLQRDVKNYDERATRIDTEDGSYGFLVTPGVRGAHTSIPEVNRFIDDHARKRRSGSVTLVSPYSG